MYIGLEPPYQSQPSGLRRGPGHRRPGFAVNVWPPMVDALALMLAAFVLVFLVGAVRQADALQRFYAAETELLRLKAEKDALKRRLEALAAGGIIQVEDGKVILQGEVLFDSGSDQLRPDGVQTLEKVGRALSPLLQAEPDQAVLVGGHTDNVPIATPRFPSNWALSTARAEAVAKVLIQSGFAPQRLVVGGFGPYHPRRDNNTEDGRRQNRRIEVLLVPIKSVSTR